MFKQVLKRGLCVIVYYSGALHLLVFILTRLKRQHSAAILFYHRFCSKSLVIDLLPHLDINEFRKQMLHIKRWYNVISMDELHTRLTNGAGFRSPSIIISIDDGYLNNYELAYPVLRDLNLPAIIYLTTGFIGTENATWVDDLGEMIVSTSLKSFFFHELFGDEVLDITDDVKKTEVVEKLYEVLLLVDHEKKMLALQKLPKLLYLNEAWRDGRDRKMLDWNEIIEMRTGGICFGAHTVSHPILNKMELYEAKREISDSKSEIESRLGEKVRHFAIPNGKIGDFNEELKKYCVEIGMETVVSTEPGLVHTESDRYFLRRICPPPPIYIFACELAMYMFLKSTQ
jgi:peptidoglycan/xylan/chitin deacetylase (PgdA/CDA1 family)